MKVEVYQYEDLGTIYDPESDIKERTIILVGKQTVKCNPRHAMIYLSQCAQEENESAFKEYCAANKVMLVCPKDLKTETLDATFRYLFREYLQLNILRDALKIGISDVTMEKEANQFSAYLLDEYDVETGKTEIITI